jgi:hypothetical protein
MARIYWLGRRAESLNSMTRIDIMGGISRLIINDEPAGDLLIGDTLYKSENFK